MLWLWGTIALVLALVFVASMFYDRRHKGSFGSGLETRRHEQDVRNDLRTGSSGNVGGFGGDGGG